MVCPYGQPGDRLWVRETWAIDYGMNGDPDMVGYRADGAVLFWDGAELTHSPEDRWEMLADPVTRWRPSIHMPRWASRITLEITGVRVERVQEISEEDARAEGLRKPDIYIGPGWSALPAFQDLWDSISAERGFGWDVNPWVWVVDFERLSP